MQIDLELWPAEVLELFHLGGESVWIEYTAREDEPHLIELTADEAIKIGTELVKLGMQATPPTPREDTPR